jgi:hypothetical protein
MHLSFTSTRCFYNIYFNPYWIYWPKLTYKKCYTSCEIILQEHLYGTACPNGTKAWSWKTNIFGLCWNLRLAALDENWNEVHEEIGNRSILDFRSRLDSLQVLLWPIIIQEEPHHHAQLYIYIGSIIIASKLMCEIEGSEVKWPTYTRYCWDEVVAFTWCET